MRLLSGMSAINIIIDEMRLTMLISYWRMAPRDQFNFESGKAPVIIHYCYTVLPQVRQVGCHVRRRGITKLRCVSKILEGG